VDAHSVGGLSAGVGVKTAGRVRPGERGGEMKSVSKQLRLHCAWTLGRKTTADRGRAEEARRKKYRLLSRQYVLPAAAVPFANARRAGAGLFGLRHGCAVHSIVA
jgi:hypothetical protein